MGAACGFGCAGAPCCSPAFAPIQISIHQIRVSQYFNTTDTILLTLSQWFIYLPEQHFELL